MIILGLNTFHGDSSAAIIRDGHLVAAVEEERFRRIKHWAGFPSESIRYCLSAAGVTLDQVDILAINQDSQANLGGKMRFLLSERPSLSLVFNRVRNRLSRDSLPELLAKAFPASSRIPHIEHVEHHVSHLSSAFHVSPFENAVVVSVDGFGDFASTAWGIGHGARINVEGRVLFPHSLGVFYQAITQYLGFPHYGDEYKVMGLAPYGQPKYLEAMRKIVIAKPDGTFELDLTYFRHHRERLSFDWDDDSPKFDDLFSPHLERLLGPRRTSSDPVDDRHRDIARSTQAMYEEVLYNLLRFLHGRHGCDAICLAGGCGANSVANGKVRRMTPFKKVYVQSAAGDAGGAIGAAFATWHKHNGVRSFVMNHANWGPSYDNESIASLLERECLRLKDLSCEVRRIEDESELCRATASEIADGKVIGWFQGRMEWGPRALGNRSIVCDPRRSDMKDILNVKIKRRESFRPFAPSILAEATSEWFEEDDAVPFMMQVFQIREEKRSYIPAVTHVDGSGRLQTVERSANARYYALIAAFRDITGIPMVLNTSFNENEPLVCKPEEALDCFIRTNMDVLVLGNHFIRRL